MNHAALKDDAGAFTNVLLCCCFAYLAGLSAITSAANQPLIAFCLAPLPLLLFRFGIFHFMILYCACNLLFFPASNLTSNVYAFQVSDSCLCIFLACYFFRRENFFSFTVPFNGLLLSLYLFLAYVMLLSIQPLFAKGPDFWLIFDIKRFLSLGLAVFFCAQPLFRPKRFVLILLAVVVFTGLYGLTAFVQFLSSHERYMAWNEVYFGNIFIVCLVLLTVIRNKKYQLLLAVTAVVLILGMLATQTRSIWLSTAVCSIFYALYSFRSIMKEFDVKKLIKVICLLVFALLLVDIIMRVAISTDLPTFIVNRMTKSSSGDLANPYSSIGYRLYESTAVWRQKTFWGHGTGAYLYLFETQSDEFKFIYWWSIHSEYMEILHKWGFFGLGLYALFAGVFLTQSMKLFLSKKKTVSAFGAIAFMTFLNTLLISVTSGYMMRVNMIMWVILMIGCVVYYRRRTRMPHNNRPASKTSIPMASP